MAVVLVKQVATQIKLLQSAWLSNASESSGLSHILRLAQITYRAMTATHRAGN